MIRRSAYPMGFLVLASCLLASPAAATGPVPRLAHVVVIVLENKNVDQVRSAPYLASLIERGASFSDYHAIAHPSQPNYLALWSGSTLGVRSNACPAPGSPFKVENLGHACESAGLAWRAYVEDLPSPGSPACKGKNYARKHAPWTNFANLDHQNERPFSEFAVDAAARRLPALAFVVPNLCNDAHNCPFSVTDAWLAANVPAMLEAIGPKGVVAITFDEDDGGRANRVLTVVAGAPVKPGYVSARTVSHYTLLRTVCDALGLPAFGAATGEEPIADIWTGAPAPGPQGAIPAPATSTGALATREGREHHHHRHHDHDKHKAESDD